MVRVLSAARVRVTLARQADYRRTAAELAARLESRGQHLWVFRSVSDPEMLLEFREGRDARALEPEGPEEAALSAHLAQVAQYAPAEALWEEMPLDKEG
jgi:hypothetical protein